VKSASLGLDCVALFKIIEKLHTMDLIPDTTRPRNALSVAQCSVQTLILIVVIRHKHIQLEKWLLRCIATLIEGQLTSC